jgi:hypothetical protein
MQAANGLFTTAVLHLKSPVPLGTASAGSPGSTENMQGLPDVGT